MDITRNMNGARALVVGAGLALALAMSAAPTPAMAAGRVGTTKVMVRTEIDNVEFKVPTVIPFVAKADGTLQGPSEDATTIDNHSAYGIHVTNMKIDAMNTWTIAADAKAGTAQNSIDFKVGPDGALQNASAAAQGTGLDLSKNAAFDMGYQGIAGGTDKIKLKTSGNVARVTRDIFRVTGEGDQVATITRHKAVALAAAVSILAFGPAMAFAQQEQAQAATQVTVDLSELDRGDREEPLAQTGDRRWLLAAGATAAGAGTAGLGLHIKRSQKQNTDRPH